MPQTKHENAADFLNGFGVLVCGVTRGNDKFGFGALHVGTPVGHDTVGGIGSVASAPVAHDRVIRDACASKASNTSPIALVLPWKMGACSKSKKFSPRNGEDFHRRTFLLNSFWPVSWST